MPRPRRRNPPLPPKPPTGRKPKPKNPETRKVDWKTKRAQQKIQKDKRFRLILDILITGQYVTHVTPTNLAEQWDLSVKEVEDMASDAARALRLQIADDDILGVTLLGGLQTIFAAAIDKGESGDAVKSALAIVGIKEKLWKAGQRQDHTTGVDMVAETMAIELALVDEARAAAAQNEAPAPAPPPPAQPEGPSP